MCISFIRDLCYKGRFLGCSLQTIIFFFMASLKYFSFLPFSPSVFPHLLFYLLIFYIWCYICCCITVTSGNYEADEPSKKIMLLCTLKTLSSMKFQRLLKKYCLKNKAREGKPLLVDSESSYAIFSHTTVNDILKI